MFESTQSFPGISLSATHSIASILAKLCIKGAAETKLTQVDLRGNPHCYTGGKQIPLISISISILLNTFIEVLHLANIASAITEVRCLG